MVANALALAGAGDAQYPIRRSGSWRGLYALATVMPRMFAPRSAPPEPDLLHAARRAAERDDARSKEMLTRRLAAPDVGGVAPTEPE